MLDLRQLNNRDNNMSEPKYKQGNRVYFNLGEGAPSGYAKVCGVMGPMIIVQPEEAIKGYAFSHIYVIDSQIVDPDQTPTKPSGA